VTTQKMKGGAIRWTGVVAVLVFAIGLTAQDAPQVVVPLSVNQVSRGEVLIRIASDDIVIRVADLEGAGLTGSTWERLKTFGGLRAAPAPLDSAEAISLRALAPLVSYNFDEATLTLSLNVDPRLLTSSALDLMSNRPPNIEYARDNTAFLNYALTSTGFRDVGLFGEIGRTFGGKLLYSSFSRAAGDELVRGATNLTIDSRDTLRRWIVGDGGVVTDALGGAALVGGVTVSRNFQLDPYFIRYPSLQVRGVATTPSQVDVYVNGLLVDRRQVNPGEFELRNLPVSAGTGVTQIVVRDVYGNERTQSDSYYFSTAVLARGMNEYTYSAGMLRDSIGATTDEYSDPAVVGFHRRGFTDYITAGFRAEATRDIRSVGPNLAYRTRVGDLQVLAGASDAFGLRGAAGLIGYNYLNRRFSVGGTVQMQTRNYAHLSLLPSADRALVNTSVFASTIVGRRGSVTAQFSDSRMRDAEDTRRLTLSSSVSLGRYANAFVAVGASEINGERSPEYTFGLSFHARHNISSSVYATSRGDESSVTAELQRPLPVGTGYGFRIGSSFGDDRDSAPTTLQYQTGFGRYEVGFDSLNSGDPSISASGGLVYGGGALMATRPVQDSYAIVRVPGVEGVRVYSSNQLIGRTNGRGVLLVPNLLAYYGNQLRIEDEDVPLDYEVRAVEKIIAPSYRGGAVVDFPVQQVRTIFGTLRVRTASGQEIVPAYGELVLSRGDERVTSPVGTAGEFYLENLESGQWPAAMEWEDGRCRFELTVPAGSEPVIRLGTIVCDAETR
jgi:outer membrane usher protein